MATILVVYHSGFGHTGVLAEAVVEGAQSSGCQVILRCLESAHQDFGPALEDARLADAIIFGSPTYMGDVSAPLKAFFEASAKPWFDLEWRDKIAAGFTNSMTASGDKTHALQSMLVNAMQHGMIWVGLGLPPGRLTNHDTAADSLNRLGVYLGAAAQSDNAEPDVTPPSGDRATARALGARVAAAALRWSRATASATESAHG